MSNLNKAMVIGRLCQDVELKYTTSGQPVANFSVATNENWTDKQGQKQEKTQFHRIVVWGKMAETCNQYISKGSQVYLEGSMETREWEDKQGQKRYTTEIISRSIQFLGSKGDNNQGQQQGYGQTQNRQSQPQQKQPQQQNYQVQNNIAFTADDIPF